MTISFDDTQTPTLSSLGLGLQLDDVALIDSGIVLISGPMASGKTTTMKALVTELKNSGRSFVQLVESEDDTQLDCKSFITDRYQKGPIKANKVTKPELIQKAHHYCITTAGRLLALPNNVKVVLIDDIRSPGTAAIAAMLAEAGTLVIATQHNSEDWETTLGKFTRMASPLRATIPAELVASVIHQTMTTDASGQAKVSVKRISVKA